MRKFLAAAFVSVTLAGCSAIPSFWDDNQSAVIVNVLLAVDKLDCEQPHAPQAQVIKDQLRWFELYSVAKGTQDVQRLVAPMQATVDDFYKRSTSEQQGSTAYCELKKKAMTQQGQAAAKAVLGRF